MTSTCCLSLEHPLEPRLASDEGRALALRLALAERDAEIARLRARVDALTAALEEQIARGERGLDAMQRQIDAMQES